VLTIVIFNFEIIAKEALGFTRLEGVRDEIEAPASTLG
jgi:hypothetical protein